MSIYDFNQQNQITCRKRPMGYYQWRREGGAQGPAPPMVWIFFTINFEFDQILSKLSTAAPPDNEKKRGFLATYYKRFVSKTVHEISSLSTWYELWFLVRLWTIM